MSSFKKIKELLTARISIKIFLPGADEFGTTAPRVIEVVGGEPMPHRKSDFRFIHIVNHDGKGEKTGEHWLTEQLVNGKWDAIIPSLSTVKSTAIKLHMDIIESGMAEILTPKRVTTVLWEGLDKDETKAWVSLQQPNFNNEETT